MIPKRRINVSYAAAVTTPPPSPAPPENNHIVSPPNIDMMDMSLHIPTPKWGTIRRLVDLEPSLLSIPYECISIQSDHTQLRNEFQKVLTGVLKHSKEIQSMQSEVRRLVTMMQEIRNVILTNAPPLPSPSPLAALRINDDISSHHVAPMIGAALSSPPRKKLYHRDESPSTSLHTMTKNLQIESGTSLNPGDCVMDTPIGIEQY
jgi:hypothetical protein